MTTVLRKYQRRGVNLIRAFDGRALLSDEMGLGKTVQALVALDEMNAYPALAVVPASLKFQWRRMAWEHIKVRATVLDGMKSKSLAPPGRTKEIYVINYEILRFWIAALRRIEANCVILDEVHMITNLRSKRTRAVQAVCGGVRHVIALSGTPLTNRPWELFPVLNLLRPDVFSSPFAYGQTYCEPVFERGQWKFPGARNLPQLHSLLKETCMIRRLKSDVLKELAPKREFILAVELEDRPEYERAERDLIGWLSGHDLPAARRAARAQRWVRYTHLRVLVGRLKARALEGWIDSFLKESEGKLLVGCIHRVLMSRLMGRYKHLAAWINGDHSSTERDAAEVRFKTDKNCRILFGQMKAAGVGLNLPEAETVLVAEIPWTPGMILQFVDRAHRMTSKGQVDVYYALTENTVEEIVCRLIDKKQKTLNLVLDGVSETADTLSLADELQTVLLQRAKK